MSKSEEKAKQQEEKVETVDTETPQQEAPQEEKELSVEEQLAVAKEQIEQEKKEDEIKRHLGDDLSDGFRRSLNIVKPDLELPYVVGYKGFRVGVRARNYHGENFHDSSLKARNEAKFLGKEDY